jgi:hypothetical protein
VTGDVLPITGVCSLTLLKNGRELTPHDFYVTPRAIKEFDGILGNDWFDANKAVINYEDKCVETPQFALPFRRTIRT